jgi:diketogulonate reductase-like aldo/keto reductase
VVCAQVLVRWGIQHGTSVIPKASSEPHLRSNLDVLNWELSKDDFKAISSIKFQVSTWCSPNNAILLSISHMHYSLLKHFPAVDSFLK